MKISLNGLLKNCSQCLNNGEKSNGYAYSLNELLGNLEEVRENPKLINEFFELYVK